MPQAGRADTRRKNGLGAGSRQTRLTMPVTKDLGPFQVHAGNAEPAPTQTLAARDMAVTTVAAASHMTGSHTATAATGHPLSKSGFAAGRVTRQGSTRLAAAAAAASSGPSSQPDASGCQSPKRDALHDATNAQAARPGTQLVPPGAKGSVQTFTQPGAVSAAAEQKHDKSAGASAGSRKPARVSKITSRFQQQKRVTDLQRKAQKPSHKKNPEHVPGDGLRSDMIKADPS